VSVPDDGVSVSAAGRAGEKKEGKKQFEPASQENPDANPTAA
jgi:hypothetical protein